MSEDQIDAIKLVRGNPTPDELAAAIAVVEAILAEEQAANSATRQQPKSTWNRNSVKLRSAINPGFGQWRATYHDGLN